MMNRETLFPGMVLLGLGVYFLLRQLEIPAIDNYLSWPVIVMVVGLAFIISSFFGRDKGAVVPGGITFFIGVHFFALEHISEWPDHWSMYPGAVGMGFLLSFLRTLEIGYLVPSGILLAFPILLLGFQGEQWIQHWWPMALIVLGLFMVFGKGKHLK